MKQPAPSLQVCAATLILLAAAVSAPAADSTNAPPAAAPGPGGRAGGGPPMSYGWSYGAGVIAKTQPYVGHDGRVLVIPILAYNGRRVQVYGPFASATLLERGPLTLAATAIYRFDGYEADDAPIFEGLKDRQDTIEAGLRAGLRTPDRRWRVELFAAGDTLHRYGGFRGDLALRHSRRAWGGTWAPELALEVLGSDYTRYYFGVADRDARPGRPAHHPGTALQPRLGFNVIQPVAGPWTCTLRAGAVWLSEEIRNSPLVDEDFELTAFLTVSRSW